MKVVDRRGDKRDDRVSMARRKLAKMESAMEAVHEFLDHDGGFSFCHDDPCFTYTEAQRELEVALGWGDGE